MKWKRKILININRIYRVSKFWVLKNFAYISEREYIICQISFFFLNLIIRTIQDLHNNITTNNTNNNNIITKTTMLTNIRIILLHLLFLASYSLICVNLFLELSEYGWDKDSITKTVFIIAIVTTVLGAIVQLVIAPVLALLE